MDQNDSSTWNAGFDLGYAEAAENIATMLKELSEGLQSLPNSKPFIHVMEALQEEFANRALCYRQKHQVHLHDAQQGEL